MGAQAILFFLNALLSLTLGDEISGANTDKQNWHDFIAGMGRKRDVLTYNVPNGQQQISEWKPESFYAKRGVAWGRSMSRMGKRFDLYKEKGAASMFDIGIGKRMSGGGRQQNLDLTKRWPVISNEWLQEWSSKSPWEDHSEKELHASNIPSKKGVAWSRKMSRIGKQFDLGMGKRPASMIGIGKKMSGGRKLNEDLTKRGMYMFPFEIMVKWSNKPTLWSSVPSDEMGVVNLDEGQSGGHSSKRGIAWSRMMGKANKRFMSGLGEMNGQDLHDGTRHTTLVESKDWENIK